LSPAASPKQRVGPLSGQIVGGGDELAQLSQHTYGRIVVRGRLSQPPPIECAGFRQHRSESGGPSSSRFGTLTSTILAPSDSRS
ncbi:MAG: hypothetical protein M3069_10095, partial [Chloroflexota bacterium]|nr:hypothetical protein [Chloroflexota bacterium]